MKAKQIGIALIGLAVILLGLLVYVKIDTDRQGAFLCEAVEADPNLTMQMCPAHENKSSWFLLIAFGIAFLVLGAGAYLLFAPQEAAAKKQVLDRTKLDESEKRVVDLLQSHDGSMYQSDLMRELGLSKVQMTRLLDKLEAKKAIDRKRRGMTNIIILK